MGNTTTKEQNVVTVGENGALGRIRTPDLLIRSEKIIQYNQRPRVTRSRCVPVRFSAVSGKSNTKNERLNHDQKDRTNRRRLYRDRVATSIFILLTYGDCVAADGGCLFRIGCMLPVKGTKMRKDSKPLPHQQQRKDER